MTAAEQIAAMDDRLVDEALRRLRWEGMETEMPQRLREVCDEAVEAARWTHLKLTLRHELVLVK